MSNNPSIRALLRASLNAYPPGRFTKENPRSEEAVAAIMRGIPAVAQRRLSQDSVAVLYDLYRWHLDLASDGCSKVSELRRLRDRSGRDAACLVHDILYKLGANRAAADAALRRICVEAGYPVRGVIRWLGVRIFGRGPYHDNEKVRRYDERMAAADG